MQTILGAGGAIGVSLAKALPDYTDQPIRLVSRSPRAKFRDTDTWMPADLTQLDEVRKAVAGSSVVYLTVGLQYNLSVWREQWPAIMKNTLTACKEYRAKLVFFDNIYLYDGDLLNPITEAHPVKPPSKKGQVRSAIATMLMEAVEKGDIEGLIARSADFYGPSTQQVSILTQTVILPLSKGKVASWMGDPEKLHSFTYTPDAGRATALLGNHPDAYGDVWHVPTASNPLTGRQWVEAFARAFGVNPRFRTVGRSMIWMLGLFVPVLREMLEMTYQNDRDYVFSSEKFEQRFGMHPTSYADGIREILRIDFGKQV